MSTPEQALRSLLRTAYLSNETVSTEELIGMLNVLGSQLQFDGDEEHGENKGMSDVYIDSLPRVPVQKLKPADTCAICQCNFLDDPYPLVGKLPRCNHQFDLECLTIWLNNNHTCPMCRDDLRKKRFEIDMSECELEPDFNMYG